MCRLAFSPLSPQTNRGRAHAVHKYLCDILYANSRLQTRWLSRHYIFNFLWSRLSRAKKARSEQRKGAAMQLFNKILTHSTAQGILRRSRQSCIVNYYVSPFNFVYSTATWGFRHCGTRKHRVHSVDLFPQSWYTLDKYKLDARAAYWPIVYCANGATKRFYGSSSGFAWSIKLFPWGALCHLADGIAFSHNINWICLYLLSTHYVCCGENTYLTSLPFRSV